MDTIGKLRSSLQKNTRATESARFVLNCMVFAGFAVSGIVEHGITVALSPSHLVLEIPAGEVGPRPRRYCDPPNMTALALYYDSNEETNIDDNYDFSQLQEMYFQTNLTRTESTELLLKKFFVWGTFFSPIPASRLAAKLGPKRIFGYSLFGAAAATLLVPAAWLTAAHPVIRFVQGLFCGALIPCAHALAVIWYPRNRRSSFVSLYSGKYVGYAICEVLTVKAIQALGSASIYYVTALLIVVWYVPWSMMALNGPKKRFLYSRPAKTGRNGRFPVKPFLCSRPAWMCIGVIFGAYCGQCSINVGMRLYLKHVYNTSDGLLSAIPFAIHSAWAVLCGYLVDYIQQTQFVSVTSSRRIFVYISHFIPAGLLFVVGFVGCKPVAPVVLYSLAVIASGAFYAGALSSPLDVSPNHAETNVAVCCTFGTAGTLLTSYLITNVLDGQVLGSWRLTFSLTSLVLFVSSIFFMLRGSGAVQPWNDTTKAVSRNSVLAPLPVLKTRTRSIYTVEKKILKVLQMQEPDRFKRVRAHSTSLPNERDRGGKENVYRPVNKKRASIS